jgi:hypothetical protein
VERRIRDDVYVKAEALQRLTEKVGELVAFSIAQLWRFPPANPEAVRLEERDRLTQMLRETAIPETKIQAIAAKITDIVIRDLASVVWRAVPKGTFSDGPAKGQDLKTVARRLHALLLSSEVGKADATLRPELERLGAWNADEDSGVRRIQTVRQAAELERRGGVTHGEDHPPRVDDEGPDR